MKKILFATFSAILLGVVAFGASSQFVRAAGETIAPNEGPTVGGNQTVITGTDFLANDYPTLRWPDAPAQQTPPNNATPITNCDDLDNIPNGDSGTYSITADIDCSAAVGYTPINNFYGTIYGNGHTISNITYSQIGDNYGGIINFMQDDAALYDIDFENINVGQLSAGTGAAIGGVVGVFNNGLISNVRMLSGTVSGDALVGGIVGSIYNNARLEFSENYATVTALNGEVGGLAGEMFGSSTVYAVKNHGDVSGFGDIGGVVGYMGNGTITIESAENHGNVTGSQYIGGVLGDASGGLIMKSSNWGTVTATAIVSAGVVGISYTGTIHDVYNRGTIISPGQLAGITSSSYTNPSVTNSYNIGTLSPENRPGISYSVGGAVVSSYYDAGLLPNALSSGGSTPKTTAEMKTQTTYAGWDFDAVWQMPLVPNVISVTVDGVAVDFTVDNAGQITITAMPAHAAGTVPVVVTYSNGATVEVPYTYLAEEITPSVPFVPSEPVVPGVPNAGFYRSAK
jgi:hypothetical protein